MGSGRSPQSVRGIYGRNTGENTVETRRSFNGINLEGTESFKLVEKKLLENRQ